MIFWGKGKLSFLCEHSPFFHNQTRICVVSPWSSCSKILTVLWMCFVPETSSSLSNCPFAAAPVADLADSSKYSPENFEDQAEKGVPCAQRSSLGLFVYETATHISRFPSKDWGSICAFIFLPCNQYLLGSSYKRVLCQMLGPKCFLYLKELVSSDWQLHARHCALLYGLS